MMREQKATSGSPRLERQVWAARAAILGERLWPALWPLVGIGGLFVVLALFAVWEHVPGFVHAAGLALFACAGLFAAAHAARAVRWPSREEALARIERDSGLAHRPLRALAEQLAAGAEDPVARTLWQVHRQRLAALLRRTRVSPPRSFLPWVDRWALRAALLLLLVVALVDAGPDAGRRLLRAFLPTPSETLRAPALAFEFWVTPPAYTRLAPFRLDPSADGETAMHSEVPEGSELVAQVHHLPPDAAAFVLDGPAGAAPFARLGPGSAEARLVVNRDGAVSVRRGEETLVRLELSVRPDRPPTVRFAGPPVETQRRTLDIRFAAEDDYAVGEVALFISPPEASDEPGGTTERRSLLRGSREPRKLDGRSFLDLTAHPRAGLPVRLELEAIDGRAQSGRSEPIEVILPERPFSHPLARAVIAQRKALVEHPDRWALVAIRLQTLAEGSEAQRVDVSVPLALFVASSRLVRQRTPEARRSVVDLLWDVALLIEDGSLSLAERQLRELQEKLQQALVDDTADARLEQLMRELSEALERYLDELGRRAMEQLAEQLRRGEQPRTLPLDPARSVNRDQLRQMLERARELARAGMRDAAREMLAQLQQMLENLQAGVPQQAEQHPGEQALSDLQRMIELQQRLLERSFAMERALRQGMRPPREEGEEGVEPRQDDARGEAADPKRAAAEQEALRRALGELMRRLGESGMELPRALGSAEMQMRAARDALERGEPGTATDPQTRALDQMRQAGQAMLEQLREQMAQQPGPGRVPGSFERPGRDPLGRATRNEGGFETEGVKIPEQYDLGRARGVLEELYRRSGDRRRPAYELDYYRRLLDRF
ncbi:hypothetical protein HRbin40_02142 [bacterium HR40]|nr:hypothetical protein HRbin40_02142 [bacterium HR40]